MTSNLALTLTALITSITIASIFTIYQYLGLSQALTNLVWLESKSFNLVGGPLPFLTLSVPTILASLYLTFKHEQPFKKLLLLGSIIISTIASILAITLLLPKNGQPQINLLPYSAGWVIAVDIFKNLRTALIGTGPESFVNVFALLKPSSINLSPIWNLRFSNSSNEYLQILTTVGLLGLLSYLYGFLKTIHLALKQKSSTSPFFSASLIILIVSLLIQLFIPASLPLTTLTFIALSLVTIGLKNAPSHPLNDAVISFFAAEIIKTKTDRSSRHSKNTEVLPWIILIISLSIIFPTFYFKTRAYLAEITFYSSLKAAAANKGTDTYNLQIKAINLMPNDPRYRVSYSQTNLALANALASQPNPSDGDRSNITQLIQQAIREAKAATTLDPHSPIAWQNLANVYRQLINVAQGADQWTIAAYTKALTLDPLNPQLRLELGGVYYSLKNYDQAIRLFIQTTEAKPDWANGYYNLSSAYREAKLYPQALQAMRVVIELLEPTSADYQKAQDELKSLEKLAEAEKPQTPPTDPQTTNTEQPALVTPTSLPSPSIEPIQLPDGSGLNLPPESTSSSQ